MRIDFIRDEIKHSIESEVLVGSINRKAWSHHNRPEHKGSEANAFWPFVFSGSNMFPPVSQQPCVHDYGRMECDQRLPSDSPYPPPVLFSGNDIRSLQTSSLMLWVAASGPRNGCSGKEGWLMHRRRVDIPSSSNFLSNCLEQRQGKYRDDGASTGEGCLLN
jgi:hypothetical protein